MILYLSFEELAALGSCAERVLLANSVSGHGIAAPPQLVADVEQFSQRLTGDISISSLDDQRTLQLVVKHLLDRSRAAMDEAIILQHAAAESAVAGYFEYAHVLTVSHRLGVIGEDVEIGANVTIDRGAIGDSVVGDGSKIDNLVQIAHGVRIGRNVLLAAQVPLLTVVMAYGFWRTLRRGRELAPFLLTLALFALTFVGLGISVFPYVVPQALTIQDAASPDSSLVFMLVGAVVLIPIILTYTGWSYWVFRGKVRDVGYH